MRRLPPKPTGSHQSNQISTSFPPCEMLANHRFAKPVVPPLQRRSRLAVDNGQLGNFARMQGCLFASIFDLARYELVERLCTGGARSLPARWISPASYD